jgi:hypothetical protein
MCLEAPCSSSHILVKVWTTSSLSQRLIQPARLCLAGRAVNQALVVRNWLIGAHLLEFEQSGQDRATYGERLLSNLAGDLKTRGLKGLGISMLKELPPVLPPLPRHSPITGWRIGDNSRQTGNSPISDWRIRSRSATSLSGQSATALLDAFHRTDPDRRPAQTSLLRSGMS